MFAAVSGQAFPKKNRLLEASAYQRVFTGTEARASHRHLLLLGRGNSLSHHRLGLVIGKKNVKLAVQRNRIKRVVREFFRTRPDVAAGLDVIVLARRGTEQLDNATLSSILREQWQKLARPR